MRQALREIAIVREDEEAFALRIEAADVEKPGQMRREQIEDRLARVRVAAGGNEAGRFVQDEVEAVLWAHHFASDFDVIGRRRLHAKGAADAAVDGDPTGGNQLVTMPA